jgi:hypothetical protein
MASTPGPASALGTGLRLLVAGIHLLPSIGAFGPSQLQRLYGVSYASDQTTLLLMRHRAVLFGLLGGLIAASAFRRELRKAGDAMGFASIVSFLVLERFHGHGNGLVLRVRNVDWVALVCSIGGILVG